MENTDLRYYYLDSKTGRVMSYQREENDDRQRGQCSGLPECCIEFFIKKWGMNREANPEHDKHMKQLKSQGAKFQYVPCPDCLDAKRFVDIRSCDGPHCFCGQWEKRQLVDTVNHTYRKWRRQLRSNRKRRRGWA